MLMKEIDQLLACPFCGSDAVKGWSRIHCSQCPAFMEDPHSDEQAHIEAWNRRVIATQLATELAASIIINAVKQDEAAAEAEQTAERR